MIPSHVVLRRELNELERLNILKGDIWALRRRRDPISEPFGRVLHRRMFGDVWDWAGRYRTSDKNIGVPHHAVRLHLYGLYEDARYWADSETFSADERAVRFHHALVLIHPFANGNGRWSRLMADILLARAGQPRLTYGSSTLRTDDEVRQAYVAALRAADSHDFGPLVRFARS
jgi:Fic-DOC domain mobile mystery protein B